MAWLKIYAYEKVLHLAALSAREVFARPPKGDNRVLVAMWSAAQGNFSKFLYIFLEEALTSLLYAEENGVVNCLLDALI